MEGWIKLHRKLLAKGYYKNSQYVHLWVHLLLLANHKEHEYMHDGRVFLVKEGQLITGRKTLSEQTGIPETTIERILKMLENEHQIGQQKTNKYRVITILNWKEHQNRTEERTSNGHQTDTYKNDKNENKIHLSYSVEPEEGIKAREPRPVPTPVDSVIAVWNSYPNWKALGKPGSPINPSALKELLPNAKPHREITSAVLRKRTKYSQEEFEAAIKAYATEIVNRKKSSNDWHTHRYTLYQFLTHKDVFQNYATR